VFIKAIDNKIESFLELMGGESYCLDIQSRHINSIDLAIYSAIRAQEEILEKGRFEGIKLKLGRVLVKSIDELLANQSRKLKNQIILMNSNEYIVPRL
jgi:hypothetical protein